MVKKFRSGIKAAQDKMALETQWIDSLVRGHSPAETFGLTTATAV